jgi:hypothetical protein
MGSSLVVRGISARARFADRYSVPDVQTAAPTTRASRCAVRPRSGASHRPQPCRRLRRKKSPGPDPAVVRRPRCGRGSARRAANTDRGRVRVRDREPPHWRGLGWSVDPSCDREHDERAECVARVLLQVVAGERERGEHRDQGGDGCRKAGTGSGGPREPASEYMRHRDGQRREHDHNQPRPLQPGSGHESEQLYRQHRDDQAA